MKHLILVVLLLVAACDDSTDINFKECYMPGDMKCEENKAMMCENDYLYWTFQDCNAVNQTCVFNQPDIQGGYSHLATCEDI